MKIGQKVERDTDSVMTEKEGAAKLPKTEKGVDTMGTGDYQERCNFTNSHNLYGSNNWETTPIPPKNKGSYAKGRNRNLIGRTLRTDPCGKASQDSDWALKTNGRSVAKICHIK